MSHYTSQACRNLQSGPPQVLAFRFGDKMQYVCTPASYEEAVAQAKCSFANELIHVEPACIAFSLQCPVDGKDTTVWISPMAWKGMMSDSMEYEIVDVVVSETRCFKLDELDGTSESSSGPKRRASRRHQHGKPSGCLPF